MATTPFTSTSYESTSSYDETNWNKDIWYIMYLVIAILGIIGNVAITWIVWAHRSMKTITNVFIGNIGISGLILALSVFPIIFPFGEYSSYWKIPAFCVIYEFATTIGICVFVFSLMLMSIERYNAIKYRYERYNAINDMPSIRSGVTFQIWFCSFIISLPSWLFAKFGNIDGSAGVCFLDWPAALGGVTAGQIYSFLLTLATYFIPVGIMVYTSVQLCVQLCRYKSADFTEINRVAEQQTITMFIVEVIVFAILWLPYQVYSFIFGQYSHEFYWIAMSSIVFYPSIYICMENRFQKKLKKVVRWCPCVDYEMKSLNYILSKADQSITVEGSYRPMPDLYR